MKLDRIIIKNYRGKDYDFKPGGINLFFKENGAGKTSLCDAIRYGITGLTPKDDVRNTSVRIQYENGLDTEYSRGKLTSCRVAGRKVTENALRTAVEDAIGLPIEDIKVSSSTEVFSSLKPADFLKLLLKYIPERLDFDTVIHYFSNLTDEIASECSLIFPPMPEQFGIEQVEKVYEYFFSERRALKALLQVKEGVLKSLRPYEPRRSKDEIDTELTNLLVQEKEQAGIYQKQKAYTEAKQKRDRQLARIKSLEENIATMGHPKASDEKELASIKERKAKAERKRLNFNASLATIKANISLFERTLNGLNTQVCPISDKLVCTTDKSKIRAELETSIAENKKLQKSMEDNLAEQEEIIKKCLSAEKKYEVNGRAYDTLMRYQSELKVYKANLVPLPEEPKQVVSLNEISMKKKQLEAEKKNLEDYEKKCAAQKEADELSRKISVYTYILSALTDKGEVKAQIIAYYLAMFADVCNSRAKEFAPSYEFKLISDDGVRVKVKTPSNQDFYSLDALSNGERTMAVFIIMDMLNQLSGARLLFIDNVEALDKRNLQCLKQLIENEEFRASYDHVFVCGVNHESVKDIFEGMNATYL